MNAAYQAALATIAAHERTALQPVDHEAFFAALDAPTAPTEALRAAFRRHDGTVHYEELPKTFARSRPAHGNIPAAYISMIGRDQRFRGSGYGGDLLADALKRIARAGDALWIAVVMLDVLDCGDPERVAGRKALHDGYGFTRLASNPLRMFLPLAMVRALLAEEA